jgi:hypothetical protein
MVISPSCTGTKVMPDLFEPSLLIPDLPFRVLYGKCHLASGNRCAGIRGIGLDQEIP